MPSADKAFNIDFETFDTETWGQKSTDWGKSKQYIQRSWGEFEASGVLTYLPFDAAPDAIRKHLKSFIESYATGVTRGRFLFPVNLNPQKLFISTISDEMEDAIARSRAILDIPVDPLEDVAVPYLEETWQRSIKLLRELADLFWQTGGDFLPVPGIAAAVDGSIDLFWELRDLTLLINVPADSDKAATFFGRRFGSSKLSGVLDQKDVEPRHLTGWLAGSD